MSVDGLQAGDLPRGVRVHISTSTNGPHRRVHPTPQCPYVVHHDMKEKDVEVCFDDWSVCEECQRILGIGSEEDLSRVLA